MDDFELDLEAGGKKLSKATLAALETACAMHEEACQMHASAMEERRTMHAAQMEEHNAIIGKHTAAIASIRAYMQDNGRAPVGDDKKDKPGTFRQKVVKSAEASIEIDFE